MAKDHQTSDELGLRICRNAESTELRDFLAKVGDKWSVVLVVMLARAPGRRARFSEIQKMLDGISQRVLTTTLRQLERDGFLRREVFPEVPPRVEYELTDLAEGLLGTLELLVGWFRDHSGEIQRARAAFDDRAR